MSQGNIFWANGVEQRLLVSTLLSFESVLLLASDGLLDVAQAGDGNRQLFSNLVQMLLHDGDAALDVGNRQRTLCNQIDGLLY